MALTDSGVGRIIYRGIPEGGFTMVCEEAVHTGDLLGIGTTLGSVYPVDSDAGEQGRLIAGENGATGDHIQCYVMAILGGFTDGTEAGAVYPSATDGQWTETADTDSSDSDTIVGYVLTETEILAIPSMRPDSTA